MRKAMEREGIKKNPSTRNRVDGTVILFAFSPADTPRLPLPHPSPNRQAFPHGGFLNGFHIPIENLRQLRCKGLFARLQNIHCFPAEKAVALPQTQAFSFPALTNGYQLIISSVVAPFKV